MFQFLAFIALFVIIGVIKSMVGYFKYKGQLKRFHRSEYNKDKWMCPISYCHMGNDEKDYRCKHCHKGTRY